MGCKGHGLKDMTPRPSSSQLRNLGQIHPHSPVPSPVGGDLDQQPLLTVGTKGHNAYSLTAQNWALTRGEVFNSTHSL